MIYRGRISRIEGAEVYVQVSALAVDQDFGPMEMVSTSGYSVDDYVLVTQIDGAAEDLVIIGLIKEELESISSPIPAPTQNDSFFVGTSGGSYSWRTKAQSKVHLDIDDAETAITALQSEVQPVNRGGTGKTSYTTGNYIQATGTTTLSERTPAQVKSDIGLGSATNTSDADKPVSTAQQAALDLKQNIAPLVYSTAQNFNSLTTPGSFVWSAGFGSNTNAPETNQGVLTVDGNTANSMTQVFNSYTTGYTYTRQYNGTTWTAWSRVAFTGYSDEVVAANITNLTTTSVVDVTDLTLTVTVTTTDVFFLTTHLDVLTLNTGSGTFVARLSVAGTERTSQLIWVAPAATGARTMLSKRWRITGLTAGSTVFKITASSSVANVYRINPTHSSLTIEKQV